MHPDNHFVGLLPFHIFKLYLSKGPACTRAFNQDTITVLRSAQT